MGMACWPVGYVLLSRSTAGPAPQQTGPWFLRRTALPDPGGSVVPPAAGLQPWVASKGDYPTINPPDNHQVFPPLPGNLLQGHPRGIAATGQPDRGAQYPVRRRTRLLLRHGVHTALRRGTPRKHCFDRQPAPVQSADWIVRFAMCARTHGSTMRCAAAVEPGGSTWGGHRHRSHGRGPQPMPVVIEGYETLLRPAPATLPHHPRPSVIGVKTSRPSSSWEKAEWTAASARIRPCQRLAQEVHGGGWYATGTGGGDTSVLGGSPVRFTRFHTASGPAAQPDLWHNHPSPVTVSQACSSARRLFTAHRQTRNLTPSCAGEIRRTAPAVPKAGEAISALADDPHDRLLRNLLIDVTGPAPRSSSASTSSTRRTVHQPPQPLELRAALQYTLCAHVAGLSNSLLRSLLKALLGNRRTAWCTGAPGCTTASCCRISCNPEFNRTDCRR